MRHHHPSTHGSPQLHGVLERRPGTGSLLLVFEGEHREVGGVDGQGNPRFTGQLTKAPAACLLPREALDERQLVGAVAAPGLRSDEGGVIPVLGREAGRAERDHGLDAIEPPRHRLVRHG